MSQYISLSGTVFVDYLTNSLFSTRKVSLTVETISLIEILGMLCLVEIFSIHDTI